MSKENLATNVACISGIIESNFELACDVSKNEDLYKSSISSLRSSSISDNIPIIVSKKMFPSILNSNLKGEYVKIKGEFRSCNVKGKDGKIHVYLFLYVRDINICTNKEYSYENSITLEGYICKKPIFRLTPRGCKITDVILAVNRSYGGSDYIPCIFWENNAVCARNLEIGTKISVQGRMQCREYLKKENPESEKVTKKIAYEIHICKFKQIE